MNWPELNSKYKKYLPPSLRLRSVVASLMFYRRSQEKNTIQEILLTL
jgi:hypothetical protein